MRYLITDYIGSVRQVTDSVGTVLQDNHYYPYGMLMGESSDILAANRTGSWTDAASNPFRFGGNELLTIRNAQLCDFVARIYDPATGRFITPDICREKFVPLNSYMYCGGNPIVFMDSKGENPIYSTTGKFWGTDDNGLQGEFYIMDEEKFHQNMSVQEVQECAIDTSTMAQDVLD